ncbi:MAG: polysaccharide deacetylase family protein [Pirellulales bacterium]|nr:polysaccharide deacetylase family protein [Pirellulales bacterium]
MRSLVRKLQTFVPRARSGVTIFAYHLVDGGTDSPVDISSQLFEAQLESLTGRVVGFDDALESLIEKSPCDSLLGSVLTFDDAYANFYEVVFPRLLRYRLPALLYVPTGFIDGKSPAPIRGTEQLLPCTWEQLREIQVSGLVTLGAHTVSHPSLTHVPEPEARNELRASRKRLEEQLETPIRHFCYPRGLWNADVERLVREEYATATIGGGGSVAHPFNPFRLQRVSIRREFQPDLRPIVNRRVWLEERIADHVRRIRN